MTIPSIKSENIDKFIDRITPNPLGRRGSIRANVCAWCEGPAEKFRDSLSKAEYIISGFCQDCQDKTFGR